VKGAQEPAQAAPCLVLQSPALRPFSAPPFMSVRRAGDHAGTRKVQGCLCAGKTVRATGRFRRCCPSSPAVHLPAVLFLPWPPPVQPFNYFQLILGETVPAKRSGATGLGHVRSPERQQCRARGNAAVPLGNQPGASRDQPAYRSRPCAGAARPACAPAHGTRCPGRAPGPPRYFARHLGVPRSVPPLGVGVAARLPFSLDF